MFDVLIGLDWVRIGVMVRRRGRGDMEMESGENSRTVDLPCLTEWLIGDFVLILERERLLHQDVVPINRSTLDTFILSLDFICR